MPRYTRKGLEKKIALLGGTSESAKARKLSVFYNDIVVRAKVKKYGRKSLNPYDPSDRRILSFLKRKQ